MHKSVRRISVRRTSYVFRDEVLLGSGVVGRGASPEEAHHNAYMLELIRKAIEREPERVTILDSQDYSAESLVE